MTYVKDLSNAPLDRSANQVDADPDNAMGIMSDHMQNLVDEATRANAAFEVLNQTTERLGEDGRAALNDLRDALDIGSPQSLENLIRVKQELADMTPLDRLAATLGADGDAVKSLSDDFDRLHNSAAYTVADMNTLKQSLASTFVDDGGITRFVANTARATAGIHDMSAAMAPLRTFWGAVGQGWGFWNSQVMLFGGLLPGITGHVRGWHIALDGLVEGLVSVVGALIAFGAGAAALAPSFLDIYTHLTNLRDVVEAFGVQEKPFNSWFLNLQHAMAPDAIQIYGSALDVLTGKMEGPLSTAIQGVGRDFVNGATAVSQYLQQNGDIAKVVSNGAGYMVQFGEILGNIGVALNNLIKADPGTAHFLLDLVGGLSKLLVVITSIPQPILMAALALHSLWLWGGLLGNVFLGMLNPIRAAAVAIGGLGATELATADESAGHIAQMKVAWSNLGTVLSDIGANFAAFGGKIKDAVTSFDGLKAAASGVMDSLAAIAASPWTWAIVGAAALAAIAYGFTQASSGAKAYISQMQQATAQTPATNMFSQITSNIGGLNQQIAKTQANLGTNLLSITDNFQKAGTAISSGNLISGIWNTIKAFSSLQSVSGYLAQSKNDITAYNAQINASFGQVATGTQMMVGIMKQHSDTAAQALGIMALAGVQAGDSLQTMQEKVKTLMDGYAGLGVQGAVATGAVDAVTLAAEQQESEVGKLAQGITSWLTTITGGESGLISFAQGMQGLASAASTAGDTIQVSNGKTEISTGKLAAAGTATKVLGDAMDKTTTDALNLRSAFEQQITTTGSAYNALMTLVSAAGEGAQGTQQLAQFTKDAVAQLLPFAGSSQQAQQQVLSMAESMGYGGTTIQGLTQWVGKLSGSAGLAGMNAIMAKATIAAGNLAQDANNLANAINSNLNQAIAAAILQANGGQKAFDNFADAAVKSKGDLDLMKPSALALAEELITATGNAGQAKQEFEVMAHQLGLTKTQADQLWASVVKLAQAVDGLHSKSITITATEITQGSLASAGIGAAALPKVGAASGWLVPGQGSGDTVPAMLTPGEAVVPKHLVSAVAPFLAANKVPGFASGGVVMAAPMLPPMPDTTGLALLQQQLSGLGTDVTKDTTQVANAALVTAKAQAALTAAQKTLTTDQADIKTIDAKITAAKALDTKAAATLKAAEAAESTAKSHLTALERLPLNFKDDMAVSAAKNVYNAAASKVTKDKAALAAAAKLVSSDESILSTAKSKEVSAAANYLNMQRLQRNDETALALAQLDQKQTSTQLSQLQTIQAGGAGISSMNDLLLPGTPLSTLAAAMPGVGLAWGAPAVAAAAAVPPLPVNSFDSGGYLPQGLSLAMNNTGAPEPVGGAGGEIHNHISVHLDGQQIQQSVQKSTLRYNIRNNGLATGLMKPR